jgi:uncharacterized membrane protein (DUF373 family)
MNANKDKLITKTEDVIYLILSALAILFIAIEVVDLCFVFYTEIRQFSFSDSKPLGLSGVPIFFNIIITLEILETFKNHHSDILGKVKLILLIAITAIVRKLITMDIKYSEYHLLFGIAGLILSLCVGYYFLAKKGTSFSNNLNSPNEHTND